MASDENSNMGVSQEDEYDHDTDDGYYDHNELPHQHNLSRLSVCTSSMYTNEDDDYQDCDGMKMFMSRLSIESFDADEELSDDDDDQEGFVTMLDLSSDSDQELGCYSLPVTPTRRRSRNSGLASQLQGKEYASENEARKGKKKIKTLRRRRRVLRERWLDGDYMSKNSNYKKKDEESSSGVGVGNSCGESENGGVMVITRPKGGKRALCMDLDEVKACRDLGFELEHERMLEMPASRVSFSGSTLDTTSSGGNSPIANWRISSPGDDPKDVKARLKVWAQAVALASASKHSCF